MARKQTGQGLEGILDQNGSKDVKQFLRKIRAEKREILALMQLREQLRESLYLQAIRYDKEPSGVENTDFQSEKMLKVCELTEVITTRLEELACQKLNVLKTVSKIEDVNCRIVIELYYLTAKNSYEMYSWEDVAEKMGYHVKYVLRVIHPKALEEFSKVVT